MSATAVNGPGLYGKLPARGDFLTRHLPRDFVEPWDDWLQGALAASRRTLGEQWLSRYLVSPLWRFVLAPGVCGPRAACGVLMPSVDRVGRYFPLTLAVTPPRRPAPPDSEWFDRAETLLLEALEEPADLERWLARVRSLGHPGDGPAGPPPDPTVSERCYHPLDQGQVPNLSHPALAAAPGLWWTTGGEGITPCLLTTRGLPDGESFAALLDGHWQRHGWYRQDLPPGGTLQEG